MKKKQETNIARANAFNYSSDEAFHDMIVAFFQQGQNGPDFGMGKTDVVC